MSRKAADMLAALIVGTLFALALYGCWVVGQGNVRSNIQHTNTTTSTTIEAP